MKKNEELYNRIKNGLIVSCQALEDEAMYSDKGGVMPLFAIAAMRAGAVGIRANSVRDIDEIASHVNLPIIGIIKGQYEGHPQHITVTMKEVDELVRSKADIIALDCTDRTRPGNYSNVEFVSAIKKKYPEIVIMADISNYEEAVVMDQLGVDYIGTTLSGYTHNCDYTEGANFDLVEKLAKNLQTPIIAEGRIHTPEDAKKMLDLGAHCVVVGGAITRPYEITTRFIKKINE